MDKFFERLGETITSKSKEFTKKAKDMVDVNTVKSNITEQKRLIRKTYASIGEQYYKQHVGTGEHEYEVEFETIGEATAKLKELYAELNALKRVRVCPDCGVDVAVESVFCNHCGTKLPEEPVTGDVCDAEEARSEDDIEVESVVTEEELEEELVEVLSEAEELVEELEEVMESVDSFIEDVKHVEE